MRVAAVIMECNPFHQGHRYILQKAREVTDADHVVVVMSGDFVQRGEPAILPKEKRVRDVLENGADLVIELPIVYATGAADWFARGAVTILEKLGLVTDLVFGSGSGDLSWLAAAAKALSGKDPEVEAAIRSGLSAGLSYPAARSCALQEIRHLPMPVDANDLLAVEYLRALDKTNSSIRPHAVRRASADAASDIRRQIRRQNSSAMSVDTFSAALLYRLVSDCVLSAEPLARYADVSPDLANRIREKLPEYQSFSSFTDLLKTRNYTRTRISRSLLHVLLGITQEEMNVCQNAGLVGYARILGARKNSPLLSSLARTSAVPLVTSLSKALKSTDTADPSAEIQAPFLSLLQKDIYASELYDAFRKDAADALPAKGELSKGIIIC